MKKPTTLLKQFKTERDKFYKENEVISEVMEMNETLKSAPMKDWQPGDLSRAVSKIAIYLVNVGQLVSDLETAANANYIFYKWQRADHVQRLTKEADKGITLAKEVAELEVTEELQDKMFARYMADSVKSLYDDMERLVSTIQTRLRVMENEKIRTRGQSPG